MEPGGENASEHHRQLVLLASEALPAVRDGADNTALEFVMRFVADAADGRQETRDLVLLLFAECSALVATLGSGGQTPVKMQVFDADGAELSIDEADPPVRTAVRTLLAEVHGDADSARAQVDIALEAGEPAEMSAVVLQALRWTARLAGECRHRELPVPEWIASALDG
ncbi:MAG: hypothetical protein ACRDRL_12330 [Sciscionella sp.]